jgi:hypothetical protein
MKRGSKLSEINIFSVLKSQIYDLLKQKQDDRAHFKEDGAQPRMHKGHTSTATL